MLRDPRHVRLLKSNGDHFCEVAIESSDDPSVIIFNRCVYMANEDEDGEEVFTEVEFIVVGGAAAMPR